MHYFISFNHQKRFDLKFVLFNRCMTVIDFSVFQFLKSQTLIGTRFENHAFSVLVVNQSLNIGQWLVFTPVKERFTVKQNVKLSASIV